MNSQNQAEPEFEQRSSADSTTVKEGTDTAPSGVVASQPIPIDPEAEESHDLDDLEEYEDDEEEETVNQLSQSTALYKTIPASTDLTQYTSLQVTNPAILHSMLTAKANMMVESGETKVDNVLNALLVYNSERANPRLDRDAINNIANHALGKVKKEMTAPAADQIRIYSGDKWLNLNLTSPEEEVIAGSPDNVLVRAGTKNLIEAPEKSFKTTALLRWAVGASKGISVFPQLPVIAPKKVLYLHGELSLPEMKERLISAVQGFDPPFDNFFQGLDLRSHLIEEGGQALIRGLLAHFKPQILVLDPWQSFITGVDENSFKEISQAMRFLDKLIQETGVTLLIPIHQGKNHKRGARGHSSLAGWRDTRLILTPSNGQVRVTIEPRWAKKPEPFVLKFKDGTVWPEKDSGWSGQAGEIRKFVESHGGRASKQALGAHLSLKSDALRKAIKRAVEADAIAVEGDDVVLE
jgi:hypothetical protein